MVASDWSTNYFYETKIRWRHNPSYSKNKRKNKKKIEKFVFWWITWWVRILKIYFWPIWIRNCSNMSTLKPTPCRHRGTDRHLYWSSSNWNDRHWKCFWIGLDYILYFIYYRLYHIVYMICSLYVVYYIVYTIESIDSIDYI